MFHKCSIPAYFMSVLYNLTKGKDTILRSIQTTKNTNLCFVPDNKYSFIFSGPISGVGLKTTDIFHTQGSFVKVNIFTACSFLLVFSPSLSPENIKRFKYMSTLLIIFFLNQYLLPPVPPVSLSPPLTTSILSTTPFLLSLLSSPLLPFFLIPSPPPSP